MEDIPFSILFGTLAFLIIASGFFSGSETGLMSLNRYRLRHLADQNKKGARTALRLLSRPERLIGVILLGNNFVNILAASIASIIGFHLYGEKGVMIASMILTVIILIFSEVTPKTLAALNPERFALPASYVLEPILKVMYPIVWLTNQAANGIFRLLGVSKYQVSQYDLSTEELRIVVNEAGTVIPQRHQQMLLNLLDLEKVTVEDIMVPRNEIIGIDLEDDWDKIMKDLNQSQHTKLPVYEGDIDKIIGFLHLRKSIQIFKDPEGVNKDTLRKIIRDPYFVPEGTPLNTQLLNFQREKRRIGLIVDEYGEILGLITLEDLLEEIVGEFTTDPAAKSKDIHIQDDGSYLIDGSASVRELNRILEWDLPTEGPKTINGLIIEYLEHIPDPGTSLLIANYPIEIVQTTNNTVKTVRIDADWKEKLKKEPD
ncbi:MAG: HlyC/CorC family transporter [Thioalkalispiraceae bacterium]